MKIKKEYVILAVVIFTLSGYLLVKKNNRLHYTLPATPAIAEKAITGFELQMGDKKITLSKKNDAWFIKPGDYPADKGKVKRLIAAVTGFSLNTLISESGDYQRYDLTDDKKVAVKVLGNNGPLFSFAVGKHAPTFQHTFVTVDGDKNVYLANGNFRSDFEQSAGDLRDKHVLTFSKDTLTAIEITDGGKTVNLTKKAVEKQEAKEKTKPEAVADQWTEADGKKVPEAAMNDFISELTGLQCDSYVEGGKKSDFKDPILAVTLKGDKESTLSIFEKSDKKADSYPAVSSTNDYPFYLPKYRIELIRKAIKEVHVEKSEQKAEERGKPVAQK